MQPAGVAELAAGQIEADTDAGERQREGLRHTHARHVAQILAKENDFAHIKLPSGEVRLVPAKSYATIGQCSNIDNENIQVIDALICLLS